MSTQGNKEKDRGKEFEGSWCRVVFLMALTYGILYGYLRLIHVQQAELNAVVPAIGFNISTWTVPYVKILWMMTKDYFAERDRVLITCMSQGTSRNNSDHDLSVEVTDDIV